MKNSTLEGAANSAPVQSKNHNPSGSTKGPKGQKGELRQVVISNTNRAPEKDKNFKIGLNSK